MKGKKKIRIRKLKWRDWKTWEKSKEDVGQVSTYEAVLNLNAPWACCPYNVHPRGPCHVIDVTTFEVLVVVVIRCVEWVAWGGVMWSTWAGVNYCGSLRATRRHLVVDSEPCPLCKVDCWVWHTKGPVTYRDWAQLSSLKALRLDSLRQISFNKTWWPCHI